MKHEKSPKLRVGCLWGCKSGCQIIANSNTKSNAPEIIVTDKSGKVMPENKRSPIDAINDLLKINLHQDNKVCSGDIRFNTHKFMQTIDKLKELLRQDGQFEANTRPTNQVEILKETALCFELLYFEDFTFRKGSIAGDIYVTKIKDIFSQPKRKKYHPLNHPGPSVFHINFKISECKGNEGVYSHKTQTITVHPDFNDFITLMHEMIHAYDDQMTHAQAEILTIMLYNKLKCKIKNLDLVLFAWAQYDNQKKLELNGEAAHEVLFLLKSLDLELRLDLPVGTISGFFSKRKDILQAPAGKIKIERIPDNP